MYATVTFLGMISLPTKRKKYQNNSMINKQMLKVSTPRSLSGAFRRLLRSSGYGHTPSSDDKNRPEITQPWRSIIQKTLNGNLASFGAIFLPAKKST